MKKNVLVLFLASLCFLQGSAFCQTSKIDRENLERIALMEENALVLDDEECCFHLAEHYYFDDKCYRKAMYWAFKGAEKGSAKCMLLLREAYGAGFGVVQNTEECLKWLVLAAAIGNEEAQKEVSILERPNYKTLSLLPDADARSIIKDHEVQWKEVKKRAKAWMDSHQSLFLSKD
jgi:TPR repeat protein